MASQLTVVVSCVIHGSECMHVGSGGVAWRPHICHPGSRVASGECTSGFPRDLLVSRHWNKSWER